MSNYQIKWKRGDYISLGKAVSQFNKKVRELEKLDNNITLPSLINYQDVKSEIKTRYELNRYIKALRRFQNENKQKGVELEGGEIVTKWQNEELKKAVKRERLEIEKELERLNKPIQGSKYSRIQMRKYKSKNIASKT